MTYFMLRRENAKRDRANEGRVIQHTIDEDLSDMGNKNFRYVL
jgi:hypothetical protein